MKLDAIEIYTGKPDFEYEPVREVEAKCESSHAFSNAPSMDEVNARLRALAAKVGANAIINVDYNSGISLTSWRALTGRGLAVRRISDERTCPFCAETVKRAAVKCRFCGEALPPEEAKEPSRPAAAPSSPQRVGSQEPLRSSDAMPAWVWITIGGIVLLIFIFSMGSMSSY